MTLNEILSARPEGSTFRIAFLGGSITEGAGASDRKNRYSSRTVAAIAHRYPALNIEEINAGVGGTPSALGLFRTERDIVEKEPDLVFVEFAVNDGGNAECGKYMEGIVRRLLRYKRDLPIVFLYTFAANMYEGYLEGKEPVSVRAHHAIAAHYGIPEINLGPDFTRKIRAYGGDHLVLLKDGAHPNNDGYATYTDTVMATLFDFDFAIRFPEETASGVEYTSPHMEYASKVLADHPEDFSGFAVSSFSLYGRTADYIYAPLPGSRLTFRFRGRALGAYIAIEKDSGDMLLSVDGGEEKCVSTWDTYALRFNRSAFAMLWEGEEGDHTLTLTVAPTKNEKSEGHIVRIGAFLVG